MFFKKFLFIIMPFAVSFVAHAMQRETTQETQASRGRKRGLEHPSEVEPKSQKTEFVALNQQLSSLPESQRAEALEVALQRSPSFNYWVVENGWEKVDFPSADIFEQGTITRTILETQILDASDSLKPHLAALALHYKNALGDPSLMAHYATMIVQNLRKANLVNHFSQLLRVFAQHAPQFAKFEAVYSVFNRNNDTSYFACST